MISAEELQCLRDALRIRLKSNVGPSNAEIARCRNKAAAEVDRLAGPVEETAALFYYFSQSGLYDDFALMIVADSFTARELRLSHAYTAQLRGIAEAISSEGMEFPDVLRWFEMALKASRKR